MNHSPSAPSIRLRGLAAATLIAVAALASMGTGPAAAAPAPEGRSVTITAVGDTMLGNTPQLPSGPYRYMDGVADELTRNSQILVMNLEGTLTSAGDSKCGAGSSDCYAFRTPKSFAKAYRAAGVKVASSANNHYNDFGAQGQRDTAAALKAAGIVQTGRPGQIGIVKAGGVTVAFVGFAPYHWAANLLDVPAARALIKRAARRADQVVVYMHAGAEGASKTHVTGRTEFAYGENRGNPQAFARMAIDAGANLVLGSGPHVLRGMEYYRNRLIAYSLGNFAGYNNFGSSGLTSRSAILRVTLNGKGRFEAGQVFPVTLSRSGRPARGGASLQMIQALSKRDFGSKGVRFRANGTLRAP